MSIFTILFYIHLLNQSDEEIKLDYKKNQFILQIANIFFS